jgi:hypothetical protein
MRALKHIQPTTEGAASNGAFCFYGWNLGRLRSNSSNSRASQYLTRFTIKGGGSKPCSVHLSTVLTDLLYLSATSFESSLRGVAVADAITPFLLLLLLWRDISLR